jgi:hypothetical protein
MLEKLGRKTMDKTIKLTVTEVRDMFVKYLAKPGSPNIPTISERYGLGRGDLFQFTSGAAGNSGEGKIYDAIKQELDLEDETIIVPYLHETDTEVSPKLRYSHDQLLEIENINECRKGYGLKLLTIKTATCFMCHRKFETTGHRTCERCREHVTNRSTGMVVGRQYHATI